MKTANQIAAEIAARITEHGTINFMGGTGRSYTPDEFHAEIAERAILADRAQHEAARRYVVMVCGTSKNRDMPEVEISRYDSRYDATAVANHWNAGNGKYGFEYWVEDES